MIQFSKLVWIFTINQVGENMTVYILVEEVDIIGVYKTRQEALNDALRYELRNWFVDSKELKL
jgi:hypothetical protein